MNPHHWIWLFTLVIFGWLGSTARYLNDLGRQNLQFSFVGWCTTSTVGAVIAVLAGFACKHFQLSDELTYVTVGVAAISAKELIETLPNFLVKILNRPPK